LEVFHDVVAHAVRAGAVNHLLPRAVSPTELTVVPEPSPLRSRPHKIFEPMRIQGRSRSHLLSRTSSMFRTTEGHDSPTYKNNNSWIGNRPRNYSTANRGYCTQSRFSWDLLCCRGHNAIKMAFKLKIAGLSQDTLTLQ